MASFAGEFSVCGSELATTSLVISFGVMQTRASAVKGGVNPAVTKFDPDSTFEYEVSSALFVRQLPMTTCYGGPIVASKVSTAMFWPLVVEYAASAPVTPS